MLTDRRAAIDSKKAEYVNIRANKDSCVRPILKVVVFTEITAFRTVRISLTAASSVNVASMS